MEDNQKKLLKIKNKIKKDSFHLFFISNPIFELITFLWINLLKLPEDKVILIILRNNSTGIFKDKYIFFKKTKLDLLYQKLNFDRYSEKILKWTNQNTSQYYVYCARLHEEAEKLINQKNCLGHFYIEEGQLSHNSKKIFDKNFVVDKKKLNKPTYAAYKEYQFRKDAISFIGIDDNVFPLADVEKKIILEDLDLIKKVYKPLLIGKPNIALIPAPRRLEKIKFSKFLEAFFNLIPRGSTIKFHPGYQYSDQKLKELEEYFKNKFNNSYSVCSNKVILEIEMMYEKKYIYGAESSLEIYAKKFKSSFKYINLY